MMKKNKVILAFLLFVLLMCGLYLVTLMQNQEVDLSNQDKKALWSDYEVREMSIEGKKRKLIVADTPERMQQGLMYVRKPVKGFDGMIFLFDDTAIRTFWNKNTFVDLTLYWMNDEVVVGKSELPSIERSGEIVRVRSPAPADAVVEIIQ